MSVPDLDTGEFLAEFRRFNEAMERIAYSQRRRADADERSAKANEIIAREWERRGTRDSAIESSIQMIFDARAEIRGIFKRIADTLDESTRQIVAKSEEKPDEPS